MEGLPFDFGPEDDADDDGKEKAKKNLSKSKNRKLGEEVFGLVNKDDGVEVKKPKPENEATSSDKTPELDTEAPVEHLSRVEVETINQNLASERLEEIRPTEQEPISSEEIATENFLENVEISGDVQEAFDQTLSELGIVLSPTEQDQFNNLEVEAPSEPDDSTDEDQPRYRPVVPIQSPIYPTPNRSIPTTNNFDQAPSFESRANQGNKSSKEGLIDGIIDDLIGRRRGRIKSERKILPVQNKLEKEVIQLKSQLNVRESYIRQFASVKSSPESTSFTSQKRRPEHIGKVLVDAELPPEKAKLRPVETEPDKMPELNFRKAQTMNRAELLRVAQKVLIDGTSLRQIYEAHLLGEKGLRRILAVYLRGGDVKRVLKRELIEKEIDFERDPRLRDQASDQALSFKQSNLDNLLHKSGIDWTEPSIFQAPNKRTARSLPFQSSPKTYSSGLRRIADILLVGLIMILAAVIIALILNK